MRYSMDTEMTIFMAVLGRTGANKRVALGSFGFDGWVFTTKVARTRKGENRQST
jgi:hypothetical protein